ncbi:hypothetical protein SOVF_024100 [Spinacia oleracea]|nr:hypothetical protein SOVF_024100 [Spinacia oleracea]
MAEEFDNLLNPEFDEQPLFTTKKRKKLIGLDDLFNDHKKKQDKTKKGKSKAVKTRNVCESDDDDDANETASKLTEALQNFKKTISEVDEDIGALNDIGREGISSNWGLQVFGTQRSPSPLAVPHLEGCSLLQNSMNNVLDALLDDSSQMGETFLEGLLLNGWLSKLVITRGHLEESIGKWTVNLLLYSSEESLMASACDFWCAIFCNEADAPVVKVEWLPGFVELNRALDSFGFQMHLPKKISSPADPTLDSSNHRGPPTNIRTWIKLANACFQVRRRYLALSKQEAEELIGMLICLFLERKLLGLTGALHDCLLSAIYFFEEKEWSSSCEKVAKSIADRIPRDLNCLRAVDSILGVDTRSKQLRSVVASQFLASFYTELQVTDAKDLLKFLLSNNLKDKNCNFSKIYLCLVLTENWLLFRTETGPLVNELWRSFIHKCSIQISNTNYRPFAQEIRNRASYLLHSTVRG